MDRQTSSAAFNASRRQGHDRIWALIFLICWVGSVGIGAHAAMHSRLEIFPKQDFEAQRGRLLLAIKLQALQPAGRRLLLGTSLTGSLALGLLLLYLLPQHSLAFTRTAAVLLFFWSVWLLAASGKSLTTLAPFVLFLGVGLLLLLCLEWRRIQLAGQLLGVAACMVKADPALVVFMLVASLLGLAAIGTPLVLLGLAAKDGQVLLQDVKFAPAEAWCRKVAWRIGACWVPTWRHRNAIAFLAVMAWWAASLLAQLLIYVTAGVAAQQWIGGSDVEEVATGSGSSSSSAARTWRESMWRLNLSLGHALEPSLGSLALAACPLAAPAIFMHQALARAMGDAARRGCTVPRGLLVHGPAHCLRGMLVRWAGVETVLMACTGASYAQSAAAATALVSWPLLPVIFYAVWANAGLLCAALFAAVRLFGMLLTLAYDFPRLHFSSALHRAISGADITTLRGMLELTGYTTTLPALMLALLACLLLNVASAVIVLWMMEREDGVAVQQPKSRVHTAKLVVNELLSPLSGQRESASAGAVYNWGTAARRWLVGFWRRPFWGNLDPCFLLISCMSDHCCPQKENDPRFEL